MPAKITLIGLYQFDNMLFEQLNLPEGLNKQTLIDNILLRSGDFEVLYPDPDFMKDAIGAWDRKWYDTFKRWIDALNIDYDPLENYNRYEHWTDASVGTASGSTSGTTGSTTTEKASAYDAGDALTTRGQTEINAADSTTSSSNTGSNGEHDGRIHGNIGVTTSQQMLLSELDIGYWNVYERITGLFLTEFVLPIY